MYDCSTTQNEIHRYLGARGILYSNFAYDFTKMWPEPCILPI
ncbi:hypothetical protein V6Z11_D09G054700 [Gossypium hirsutum]